MRGFLFRCALFGSGLGFLYGQVPKPWQMHFQPAATPVMEKIVCLHDMIFWIMATIVVLVLGLLVFIAIRFRASRNPIPSRTTHHTTLEVIWTLIPVAVVLAIAIPSLRLQFYMNRIHDPELTIKVIGHQWYWSYEYPDHHIEFESRMIPDADIHAHQVRLLSVDKPLFVPVNTNIRILTTSQDVIHSWAIPSFGLKKDTIPGRLNETWMRVTKEGIFYGQCSELCGAQHGFMPIEVHVVSKARFQKWLDDQKPATTGATSTARKPPIPSTPPLSTKGTPHGT